MRCDQGIDVVDITGFIYVSHAGAVLRPNRSQPNGRTKRVRKRRTVGSHAGRFVPHVRSKVGAAKRVCAYTSEARTDTPARWAQHPFRYA